ncbi:MAG: DUF2334 domain-containing protein [Candidatus Woesearchaeota archaeon]
MSKSDSKEHIELCRWWNDFKAPVVIWCDDFGGAGSIEKPFKDAGWAKFQADTGARRVHMVMKEHPQAILTYFIVPNWADKSFAKDQNLKWENTQSIDDNSRGFSKWLEALSQMSFYEFQLHGFNHKYIKGTKKTKHEFELYNSLDKAEDQLNKAIKKFNSVFNKYPTGNRFPGWKLGEYGYKIMKSLDIKWCSNLEGKMEYDIVDEVVNLPIGYKIDQMTTDKIDKNINNGKGIYITSHVEGYTPTSRINTGMYQNYEKLHFILSYIENNYDNIWFAGGEEVAKYIYIREKTKVYDVISKKDKLEFKLEYDGDWKDPQLSLKMKDDLKEIKVELPNGNNLKEKKIFKKNDGNYILNIPVMDGKYLIKMLKYSEKKPNIKKEKYSSESSTPNIKKGIEPVPTTYKFYNSGLSTHWRLFDGKLDNILKKAALTEITYIKKGFFVFNAEDLVLEREVLLTPPFEITINPQSFSYWSLSIKNIFTEIFVGFILAICKFTSLENPFKWMKKLPPRLLFFR